MIAFTNFPYTLFACRDESFIIRRGPVPFRGGWGGGGRNYDIFGDLLGGCGESEINNLWSRAGGRGSYIFRHIESSEFSFSFL